MKKKIALFTLSLVLITTLASSRDCSMEITQAFNSGRMIGAAEGVGFFFGYSGFTCPCHDNRFVNQFSLMEQAVGISVDQLISACDKACRAGKQEKIKKGR
jgi:hypothetical protein